ncbi:MAG TPA: hypothetical protein VGG71_02640 [Chitinophagaceae bacterium]
MIMLTSLQIFLLLHLSGFALLAGTVLTNYLISVQCWKYIETNKQKALTINSSILILNRVTAIGGIITVLSGIIMVIILHGTVFSQLWFRIKMVVLVLIIMNSVTVARRQSLKLNTFLAGQNEIQALDPAAIKLNLSRYYMMQFMLLLTILVLSVFKFN